MGYLNNMKVINLFAGPGTGKSTNAAYIFAKLKEAGINCEYVQEYAKDKTWEEHTKALSCQPYVTGKQFWRLFKLRDQVQLVVTDSPMILGTMYQGWGCSPDWEKGVVHQFKMFDNINIFLVRNTDKHPYNPKGRNQSEDQAVEIDRKTRLMLETHSIPFHEIKVDDCEKVWQQVRSILIAEGFNLPANPGPESWV